MKNNALLIWAIKNIVILICFSLLSIYFGKWWIVLFSVLFFSYIKTGSTTCYCDKCGRQLPVSGTFEEVVKAKQEYGWNRRKNGDKWEDICPECQKEEVDHA